MNILKKYKKGKLTLDVFLAAGYLLESGDRIRDAGFNREITDFDSWNQSSVVDSYRIVAYSAALDRLIAQKDAEQKPVFTQAMKDAGELPPVGSWAGHFVNNKLCDVEVIAHRVVNNMKVAVFAFDNGVDVESYTCSSFDSFTPIKSPEEKLVEDLVHAIEGLTINNAKLLVAQYNITPK